MGHCAVTKRCVGVKRRMLGAVTVARAHDTIMACTPRHNDAMGKCKSCTQELVPVSLSPHTQFAGILVILGEICRLSIPVGCLGGSRIVLFSSKN